MIVKAFLKILLIHSVTSAHVTLPPLDARLAREHNASDTTLIVTLSNYVPGSSQADMLSSWIKQLKNMQLPCVVGICAAEAPVRADVRRLVKHRHCAVAHVAQPECVTNPKVCRAHLAQRMLVEKWGLSMLYLDADVAVLRDPLPYFAALFAAHPTVDVLASSDTNTGVYVASDVVPRLQRTEEQKTLLRRVFPDLKGPAYGQPVRKRELPDPPEDLLRALHAGDRDIGLEFPGNCMPHQYNSGVLLVRNTSRALALMTLWVDALKPTAQSPVADDQLPFNRVAKHAATHCSDGAAGADALLCNDSRLNAVAGGTACFGLLNVVQFANGFTYAMSRAHEQYGVEPFTYHATYTENKVFSLLEQNVFFSDETPHEKYITYEPLLLFDMIIPGATYTYEDNYKFIQHQLLQLRNALIIAEKTHRTLILPRFAAICQCFFFRGKACTIEGHRVALPHVAPTAHVLQVDRLVQRHRVREPNFLSTATTSVRLIGSQLVDSVQSALHQTYSHRVIELTGAQLLAADMKGNISEDILGSWCCTLGGNGNDLRVRYHFEGPPTMISAEDASAGRCVV